MVTLSEFIGGVANKLLGIGEITSGQSELGIGCATGNLGDSARALVTIKTPTLNKKVDPAPSYNSVYSALKTSISQADSYVLGRNMTTVEIIQKVLFNALAIRVPHWDAGRYDSKDLIGIDPAMATVQTFTGLNNEVSVANINGYFSNMTTAINKYTAPTFYKMSFVSATTSSSCSSCSSSSSTSSSSCSCSSCSSSWFIAYYDIGM